METRTLNKILIVGIAVLLAAVAFLLFRTFRPPVPPVVNPLADRPAGAAPGLNEEQREMARKYDKAAAAFFAAQEKQENELRAKLAAAGEEQRQRLEAEIAALRKEREGLAAALSTWRHHLDQRGERAAATPAAPPPHFPGPGVEPPPLPPPPAPPSGDGGEGKKKADEQFRQFLSLAAAGICLAQPEICPAVLALVKILGILGSGDGGTEIVDIMDRVQRGEPVDPETLRSAGALLRDHPDAAAAFGDFLAGEQERAKEGGRQGVIDSIGQVAAGLTNSATGSAVVEHIVEAVRSGAGCAEVSSFLEQSGGEARFANPAQREAARAGILALRDPQLTGRSWTSCLQSLAVQ